MTRICEYEDRALILVSTQRNEEQIDRYIVRNLTPTGFYQIDNQCHVPTQLWNTTVETLRHASFVFNATVLHSSADCSISGDCTCNACNMRLLFSIHSYRHCMCSLH